MSDRTFVVFAAVRTVGDFEKFAREVAPLRRHGRVEMGVSSLSGKDWDEIPAGGSAWHEYVSYGLGLHKFFPHPKIKPFLNAKFLQTNRRQMQGCLEVLRKHKMGAAFSCHEMRHLPEPFFRKYPQLRGPRVDHPRRSRVEAFSMCIDLPEVQEMVSTMVSQMVKEVPELGTLRIMTNDAGGGFCWNDWLYSGPNGPDHCLGVGAGTRFARFEKAVRKGAGKRALDLHLFGNFSRAEVEDINQHVPGDDFFMSAGNSNPRVLGVGPVIDNPVVGVIDPVGMLKTLEGWRRPGVKKVFINFSSNYARGHDTYLNAARTVEVIDEFLRRPAYGPIARLELLRGLCARWAGAKNADKLLEAFIALHEAYEYKNAAIPGFRSNYIGVSMRHITRPLVVKPELLTKEEESYFLPHIFNVSENEARMDYRDLHGGQMQFVETSEGSGDPRLGAPGQFRRRLNEVASTLEGLDGPQAAYLNGMGKSLQIYGSVMRSINNCYAMGVLRDRNAAVLAAEPIVQPKVGDWYGAADLQLVQEIMRDELDNTVELIDVLESGGLAQMVLAETAELEDTFLLGPDIVAQLRKKIAIMRRHWLDPQRWLRCPHK